MKNLISMLLFGCLLVAGCVQQVKDPVLKGDAGLKIPFDPEKYVCYKSENELVIDGVLSEEEWGQAPWSNAFVDIEGELKPTPYHQTKVKMLWDSTYFYIAAELEEPHLWGYLTQHDAVIYNDNDFEVFIDPDGDTHHYYEYEVNTLNTDWDLLLTKPYRDGALAINGWEISGLKSTVKMYGTINDPSDEDDKWIIELAFPWTALKEANTTSGKLPKNGSKWRVNFSRVQWETEIVDGTYVRKKGENGKRLPENNWVWSPQGVIAMHQPETWGYVQFSDQTSETFVSETDEDIKWALRQVYYRQKAYWKEYNRFTASSPALRLEEVRLEAKAFQPDIIVYPSGFMASYSSSSQEGTWYIREDGRVWLGK